MDVSWAKRAVREREKTTGHRDLSGRRAVNRAITRALSGGTSIEVTFQGFLRAHALAIRKNFPYLANHDGTPMELSRQTKMGGDAQGTLYTFKDRPHLVLKLGPKTNNGFTEENTFVETFSILRKQNPGKTQVVRAQNRMARRRAAPMVVAAGVFAGHRVTVMQKVHDAVTLEEKYPDNTEKDKRKWRRVFRSMASRLRAAGVCHHDLHSRNVVYGWLTDKAKYRYYLVDFDNSFLLDGEGGAVCNDRVHDDNDENVAQNTVFDGEVSMPL